MALSALLKLRKIFSYCSEDTQGTVLLTLALRRIFVLHHTLILPIRDADPKSQQTPDCTAWKCTGATSRQREEGTQATANTATQQHPTLSPMTNHVSTPITLQPREITCIYAGTKS